VEHASPIDPSRIQLDDDMAPVTMTLSGLFELQRVSAEVALAPRTALQAASYFVPIDRPLRNHQNISVLALEIEGQISPRDLWPELLAKDGRTLLLSANPVSGNEQRRSALQETSAFPVSDSRIRTLARRAVGAATRPADQVAALTSFVHDYVEYVEAGDSTHVLALLDDPRGDCSEYADLLTTLARSLDIPSRTIFGLAYADLSPPAFRFHAWNEVFIDGAWQSLDPTWNQLQVDATHIPLPENTATALQLLTGSGGLSFVVRDVRYRDG
jgi:transglutaminase-like putative cysteine protease